jgi:hypothetical protein
MPSTMMKVSTPSLAIALVLALAGTAAAAPAQAWLGTFQPASAASRCADCTKRKIQPCAGSVRVLTSADRGAPSTGDVTVVSPLLGVVWTGRLDQGRVDVPWFNYDLRDSDDGVVVLPGGTPVGLIPLSPAERKDIEQALLKNEVLSGVRRAVAGVEIGVIDIDGDGKADLAVTYGCNAWADGQCQSKGQFFLIHRGTRWVELD